MSLDDILNKTDKGKLYSHILDKSPLYPVILDSKENVLAFPPIINSEFSHITNKTKNLFVDFTGTDLKSVMDVGKVMVTTFADYGANIESVNVISPQNQINYPDLSTRKLMIKQKTINQLLGLNMNNSEIIESLQASRFNAKIINNSLSVEIPSYRIDILHPIDLVEEVAIGYGLWKIEPEKPYPIHYGTRNPLKEFTSLVSEIMVGSGFQEIMNFTLSNIQKQFKMMQIKEQNYIKIHKPKSLENEIIRTWLIPGLLQVLHLSKKELYPQNIFEIGKVASIKNGLPIENLNLGVMMINSETGYAQIKSILDSLTHILELKSSITPVQHSSFIDGRVGKIMINNVNVGTIGEIDLQVLENHQLEDPTVCFEIDLNILFNIKYK